MNIISPDPWLCPNKALLASRLGMARSTLWERTEAMARAPVSASDSGPYDVALWYAAALAAGAPVLDPVEVFPPHPKVTPQPSGECFAHILGMLHVRSSPFSGILACGPARHSLETVAQAADAYAEIVEWHLCALVAALPVEQRAAMGQAALRDLIDWHGADALGVALPAADAG